MLSKTLQLAAVLGCATSASAFQPKSLKLRLGSFDPLLEDMFAAKADVFPSSSSKTVHFDNDQYFVQFEDKFCSKTEQRLLDAGATVHFNLPESAVVVRMTAETVAAVEGMDNVRFVGRVPPAFKIDPDLIDEGIFAKNAAQQTMRFNVMLLSKGDAARTEMLDFVAEIGGAVVATTGGLRMEVDLTPSQAVEVLNHPQTQWMDRWTLPSDDMDIARARGGVDYIAHETPHNYNGEGVRGEVMDSGLFLNHPDLQASDPIIHTGNSGSTSHGTSVYGIIFGDGTADAKATGVMPKADQGIFAAYSAVGDRYGHTMELVDPDDEYRAVFQTNSWGNTQTTEYNSIAAEMDDIIYNSDLLILQSQSNTGNRNSRPQTWAKNIVSVGGHRHYDTAECTDDVWRNSASIGPASDGRVKPDLTHFYDNIYSAASSGGYSQFGGTSGATPITAGHFGLMFQMWADGVFAGQPGLNRDVFDSRPHHSTAKALMINSASQLYFQGINADFTRAHQGWGVADVGKLYDTASGNGFNLPVLVDEDFALNDGETHSYNVTVSSDELLKATLAYRDPAPLVSASKQLVNDLNLRVRTPSGEVYWGNAGLMESMCSTSGGEPGDVDNVENVILCTPEEGQYEISVLGKDILVDTMASAPGRNAGYSLVVSTYSTNPGSEESPWQSPPGCNTCDGTTPPPTTPLPGCDNNSCMYAFDVDCDDGGSGSDYSLCQYGSDCFDCCAKVPAREECQ